MTNIIKRIVALSMAAFSFVCTMTAQTPPLRFSHDKTFKIVQFTDLHFKNGNKKSLGATEMMAEVIDAERPDLVMITGDLVYSDGVAGSLEEIVKPLAERNVPWAFVFGNHDEQFDMTLGEIYDFLQGKAGCVNPARSDTISLPDYVIDISASDGSDRRAASLYCMDSHSRSPLEDVIRYAWLKHDQVSWYRNESQSRTSANGGMPVPSLMFMHIPLQEYQYALTDKHCKIKGTKGEKVCLQALNSGMFCSIKEMGDVFGVFCGHDHDNDFVVNYKNVLLGYGRFSGGKTVYNHIGKNGARVIVLKEDQPALDTYVRLKGGDIINHYSHKLKK